MGRGKNRGQPNRASQPQPSSSQPAKRALPRKITVRLKDITRHARALALAIDETPRERFIEASVSDDPDRLNKFVYPLERSFEIVGNYIAELNELGLQVAGLAPVNRPKDLRLLADENVISSSRADKWRAILDRRNRLQHDYPDVRAGAIYDAAADAIIDLPAYLRDYAGWMRRLGFGKE